MMAPERMAELVAAHAADKKAIDIVEIDLRGVSGYTDFFVVCSGRNTRQVRAIWNDVRERLKHEDRVLPHSVDGERESAWIVGDYLDVVLHVFTPETRAYYRLEDLWGDVPSIELEAASA